MEKQLFKVLKNSVSAILETSDFFHLALVCRTVEGMTVYVIIRMVSLQKPQLNEDGVIPTEKQWKYFFPFVVKASEDKEKMFSIWQGLTEYENL